MYEQYRRYTYRPIPAKNRALAEAQFHEKHGYLPLAVFGPAICQDAPGLPVVPEGYYFCAIQENSNG